MTVVLALGTGGSGARILARITRRSWDALDLRDGIDVFAQIKGVSLVAVSDQPLGAASEAPSSLDQGPGQVNVAA